MSDATPPQSELLCQVADELFTLGQSDEGEAFAISRDVPGVAISLRGRGRFRSALASAFRERHGKPPTSSALTDALMALTGDAQDEPRTSLSLRAARHGSGLVIDLGNEADGRCIVIEPGSWHVADSPPAGVVFRRTALTAPLPPPAAPGTGDLGHLFELVNLPEEDRMLVAAWMVAALDPDMPHPPFALVGQQGVAKTTTARLAIRTVDPSPALLRSASRSIEEWAVSATGSWVVGIDNVSSIAPWFQDAICRAATGDGLVRRELYTDAELSVLSFRRCVVLTGIDLGAVRGDLADRTLMVHPDPIPPEARELEADIEAAFEQHWPTITAGLYDLAAQVLEVLPSLHLANPPRMADFARIVAAVDAVTGSTALDRYASNTRDLTDDVLEADVVAVAIRALMTKRPRWSGTASELLGDLDHPTPTPKSWPTTPHHLSARISRTIPALESAGIKITHDRTAGRRIITISRDSRDAHDAVSPLFSVQERKEERRDKRDNPASPPSQASPRPDETPTPDVDDHWLDQAPPHERIPDHVLAQWELSDTADEEDAA